MLGACIASPLDSIRSLFTRHVTQAAATTLGEPVDRVQAALSVVPPMIAAGLAHRSAASGADHVAELARQYGDTSPDIEASFAAGGPMKRAFADGRAVVREIFGGDANARTLAGAVASHSGISSASAATLLALTTPVVLGVLDRILANKESAGAAATLNGLHRPSRAALPPAVGTALTNVLGAPPPTARLELVQNLRAAMPAGMARWAAVTVLSTAAILAAITWFTEQQPPPPPPRPAVPAPITPTAPPTTAPPPALNFDLVQGSIAWELARYLGDPAQTPPPRTFVFDHLFFEVGTTQLTTDSHRTVRDIASVLKTYPTAQVRLEGHTDLSGDRAANLKLSIARAEAVATALVHEGIAAERMTMGGYGSERPVAPNDSAEGRARNRRLELVVLKR